MTMRLRHLFSWSLGFAASASILAGFWRLWPSEILAHPEPSEKKPTSAKPPSPSPSPHSSPHDKGHSHDKGSHHDKGHSHDKPDKSHGHDKKGHGHEAETERCKPAEADGMGSRFRVSLAAEKRGRWKVEKVEANPGLPAVKTSGQVDLPAGARQRVGARLEGRIHRILVEEGSHVRLGQGLVWLDSPKVGELRSEFLKAKAYLEAAEIEATRASRLRKEGMLSAQSLFQAEMALRRAKITLAEAQNHLRIYGLSEPKEGQAIDGHLLLRATGGGHVTQLPVASGQWVSPQTTILEIEDHKRVWVHLRLPLRSLPLIREGQKATLTSPSLPQPITSPIRHLDIHVHPESQTVGARLEVENPQGWLRTGQIVAAQIHLSIRSEKTSLRIADAALQRIGFSIVVFLATATPGEYLLRSVIPGLSADGQTEILHGLKRGESVVTEGAFLLKSEVLRDSLGGHGH